MSQGAAHCFLCTGSVQLVSLALNTVQTFSPERRHLIWPENAFCEQTWPSITVQSRDVKLESSVPNCTKQASGSFLHAKASQLSERRSASCCFALGSHPCLCLTLASPRNRMNGPRGCPNLSVHWLCATSFPHFKPTLNVFS